MIRVTAATPSPSATGQSPLPAAHPAPAPRPGSPATSAPSRLREQVAQGLSLPVVVAPMFLVTSVDLVRAAMQAGVAAAMPTLNARSPEIWEEWAGTLSAQHAALGGRVPWAANLVVHASNSRLSADLAVCVRHRVPWVITALGSPKAVVDTVHGYGGLVFADVNTPAFARKAAAAGVDGLVLICSGAGGHTGPMTPAAFVAAVREFFDGPLIVGGGLSNGDAIRAVQAMGADLAYMGTRFIATRESAAVDAYKQMVVDSDFADIICTNAITGAWANKLRPSLVAAGLDPDKLVPRERFDLNRPESEVKAWKDLWSAGHGVGSARAIEPVAEVIASLQREYGQCLARLDNDPWMARWRQQAATGATA